MHIHTVYTCLCRFLVSLPSVASLTGVERVCYLTVSKTEPYWTRLILVQPLMIIYIFSMIFRVFTETPQIWQVSFMNVVQICPRHQRDRMNLLIEIHHSSSSFKIQNVLNSLKPRRITENTECSSCSRVNNNNVASFFKQHTPKLK